MAREIYSLLIRAKVLASATTAFVRSRCILCSLRSRGRVTKLAALSFAMRYSLTTMIVWCSWHLISLCAPLGTFRWLLLAPATAAAASILLCETLDFEATAAQRAVRGAVFAADRWGGRAETVRAHAQEFVRTYDRCPEGAHVLQDIYTSEPFTVVYGIADT